MKFVNIPVPKTIEGMNSSSKVGEILIKHSFKKPLIVTDSYLHGSGLMNSLLSSLNENSIEYIVFDGVVPNPTIDKIEETLEIYIKNKCDSLIAFGGGSPIDTAKGVGARVARPNKSIPQMKGNLKVRKELPLLIAVPTTAGTGSEATLAAVVSNHLTHEKYPINDPKLVPSYAILDPLLIKDLPGKITSTTGMDALTHAVEAYIGKSNTKFTKQMAVKAVKLIFSNIQETYNNPHNMDARNNMLKASYYAGVAFTRAYVGYVHSIAHTLGGFYNVPHGLANAIILPYVLKQFGKSAHKKLSELYDVISENKNSLSVEEKANKFIQMIEDLNKSMNIPNRIDGIIKEEDIPLMIKRADKEANPLYPVPRLFSYKDFEFIYNFIKWCGFIFH